MYRIKLFPEKNRFYIQLGTIEKGEGEQLYCDIKNLLQELNPGFTAISDITGFYLDDPGEGVWAEKILQLLVESGMKKAVRVTGSPSFGKEEKTKYGYTVAFAKTYEDAVQILDKTNHKKGSS